MAALTILVAALAAPLGLASAQTVSPVAGAPKRVLSAAPDYSSGYGIHEPQGLAAVQYLYSDQGTWRAFSGLKNVFGYYNVSEAEMEALVHYANGSNPATCEDPDLNVLFRLPYDSTAAAGHAFEEHNGRGVNGDEEGTPFSQFWFDDNYLARYMSAAYGAPLPQGLFESPTRWQIIGLDAVDWPKPLGTAPDENSLMGLYYLSQGDPTSALKEWEAVLVQAGASWDPVSLRHNYTMLDQEYYLGLFKILTDHLMDAGIAEADQEKLIQHSISLRSVILSDQQYRAGNPIGWCTDRNDNTSLINSETTTCEVLALGAGARYSYEAGLPPLSNPAGFVSRPSGVLSAVAGQSPPGPMVFGPHAQLPLGSYTADFYLRGLGPKGKLGVNLEVHDVLTDSVLASLNVTGGQLNGSKWGRFSIPFAIEDDGNEMEYLVNWGGQADLDVSAIRVR